MRSGAAQLDRLSERAVRGLAWMAFGTVGQIVLQMVVLGILARLVAPRDYGLVTAALIAVNLSTILAESGIGQAIVQRRDLQAIHLRVGLTLAVGLATVAYAALVLGAPAIAHLLDTEDVAPVLRAVAITFVIRSLSLGDHLLTRRLAFGRLATVELAGYGLGYGVVAVTLALKGYGVWAIVGGQIGQAAVRTCLLWIVAPHPMRPAISGKHLRELLAYGSGHTLARIANWFAGQGDNFVVGRWLGPGALGLYSRAYQLMVMPANLFGQVANEVGFPAMAAVRDDRPRLRAAYLRAVACVALLALPASAVAAVVSRELVLVLLGEHFAQVSAAFDVMVFGILFRTSYKLSDCLARATGAVYRRAWRQFCYAGFVFGGALVGQQAGLRGVAFGVLAALTVNFLLMAHLSLSLIGASWSSFGRAHVPALVVAAVAATACLPVAILLRTTSAPAAVVVAGAGMSAASAIVALLRLAPRIPAVSSLTRLVTTVLGMVPSRVAAHLRRLLGDSYALPLGRPCELEPVR